MRKRISIGIVLALMTAALVAAASLNYRHSFVPGNAHGGSHGVSGQW